MSEVNATDVKKLRDSTGAGFMDCKAALVEAKGNFEEAIEFLRKKGLKNIDKRAGKTAAEGSIGMYVHAGEQVVSIVELNCETDFVARNEEFKQLAKDLALHVAAMKPRYATVEEVPAEEIEKEKEIALAQLNDTQKSKADKILPGKLEKFYEEIVLLKQPYVKDETGSVTVEKLIQAYSIKCGEKVTVRRMARWEVGEGIAKVQVNLAEEVAATLGSLN